VGRAGEACPQVGRKTDAMGRGSSSGLEERTRAISLAAEPANNAWSLSNEAHGDAQAHCCSLARVE